MTCQLVVTENRADVPMTAEIEGVPGPIMTTSFLLRT
jgi:hypothetical protein